MIAMVWKMIRRGWRCLLDGVRERFLMPKA